MSYLHRDAIRKASEVRKLLEADMFQPINIFDACLKLGIEVRFVDVNMEGIYRKQGSSCTILLSNQRPLPRRVFTCGHELGHHVFGHGFKIDNLPGKNEGEVKRDPEEILVDAFSAALLMPIGGIQAEFAVRDWDIKRATAIKFFIIASLYGVGYQTLVKHCKMNSLITENHEKSLLKLTPSKIFNDNFGMLGDKSYFRIFDKHCELTVVDLEVSNFIILPSCFQTDSNYLEKIITSTEGEVYKAIKSGISTVSSTEIESNFFVRIQRQNYIGLSEYRHLEE